LCVENKIFVKMGWILEEFEVERKKVGGREYCL
jgi:hypothetical protein